MILKESNRRIKRLRKNHQSCVQCMTGGLLYTVTGQLLSSVHMREKQLLVFRNGDLIPAAAEHAGDLCREQLLRQTGVDLEAVPRWRMPKMYCVAARYIHAAVPVSHETLARPEFVALRAEEFEE